MAELFTRQNRVKLHYLVADHLFEDGYRDKVASLPVLDELLRKRFGRLELAEGDSSDEVIKNFILTAPEDELLDLIELAPIAHYSARMEIGGSFRHPSDQSLIDREVKEIATEFDLFLERVVGHPARFVYEPQFYLARTGVAMQAPAHFTKLPGRDALTTDLQHIFNNGELVTVLYIDLDHFKKVNDTHGHDEGDRCLDATVRIITGAVLKKGNLYRAGNGDEFVVVLPNFTAAEGGATAERIRLAIEHGRPGGTIMVTTSIGVVSSGGVKDAVTLLKAADKAMYESKKERNKVTIS
jgi:diguanylate cyclase (GGDEF)-like protein